MASTNPQPLRLTSGARRRRRGPALRWFALAGVIGLVAVLGAGVYALGAGGRSQRSVVRRYLADWSDGRVAAMYALLSPATRAHLSDRAFAAEIAADDTTATATGLRFSPRLRIHHDMAAVPATVSTTSFGTLHLQAVLDLGPGPSIVFLPQMAFPGLLAGERLSRSSSLGPRGTLEASDGEVLAEGPARSSPIPQVAEQIVGTLGPIPAGQAASYRARGYPAKALVGQDGLELIFQDQLAGTPGGTLRAGARVLARVAPVPGETVRTTIDPAVEEAAVSALGGGYAGMVVLNTKTGGIEAAVGLAFTDLQPPGSTFKIITTAALLQDGLATPQTTYPELSQTSVGGYIMQNAGGEVCGGTLLNAFAVSCDTTFAPLGIQLGAQRLLATAERFGFNQPTQIASALEPVIPTNLASAGPTAVGSAAIGQWQVEASPLSVADVGATIADDGERPIPTFTYGARPRFVAATTPRVAADIQKMMQAVVSYGTGTTAAIPGYAVAGKTGTAELASTTNQQNDAKETDAWFVGYVPDSKAGIVACALFPSNGYGADSAAPAVRAVLEQALGVG